MNELLNYTVYYFRFCRRHRDLLNPIHYFSSSSASSTLPLALETRAVGFHSVLTSLILEKPISSDRLGCMDELALYLTPNMMSSASAAYSPSSTSAASVNALGLRQVGLAQATACVYLSATAYGTLLPPMVVLKVRKVVITQLRERQKSTIVFAAAFEPSCKSRRIRLAQFGGDCGPLFRPRVGGDGADDGALAAFHLVQTPLVVIGQRAQPALG